MRKAYETFEECLLILVMFGACIGILGGGIYYFNKSACEARAAYLNMATEYRGLFVGCTLKSGERL